VSKRNADLVKYAKGMFLITDTSTLYSIGSWAEKEARKRLDERGEWRYKPAASS
jgi:hypothetical protein